MNRAQQNMWQSLGFSESPYDSRPLKPVPEDADLLVGRTEETISFCTTLESSAEGIQIISGQPGVGKTSFFNVQQYRLATGLSAFGPKLLVAEKPCTVHPDDDARAIALRALQSLIRSVEIECHSTDNQLPTQVKEIGKWARATAGKGFEIGVQILGIGGNYGRSVSLPSASDVSFEGITEAIECVVSEVTENLDYSGCFIALDNIENLDDISLKNLMITFRDTLFSVENVWWILIGQSGLGSLIQTLDSRVSDRLSGAGIELGPLTLKELEEAVILRVDRFGTSTDPKSPLPSDIHKSLYESSHGEMRFTFRYSHEICTKFVEHIRRLVTETMSDGKKVKSSIADQIATQLINGQIPAAQANKQMEAIFKQELAGLNLKPSDKKVLKLIGEKNELRPRDHSECGFKSTQQFYSSFISRFHHQSLLARRQEGKAVYYRLRGIAAMAYRLDLL